jgi:signal transduction histidine kinase
MNSLSEGTFELNQDFVSLNGMIEKLRGFVQIKAELKGLEFSVGHNGDIPKHIYADERRLLQVLLNLTTNAIKYTIEGKVWISIEAEIGSLLKIEVNDTGIGINPEEMQYIFDMFGLIDRKAKESETGTRRIIYIRLGAGLGLFLCKQIVTKMKGNLTIDSHAGRGTSCVLTLPLEAANNDEGRENFGSDIVTITESVNRAKSTA